jgi:hypothetical protein
MSAGMQPENLNLKLYGGKQTMKDKLAQKLFRSLVKGYYNGEYIVLNDLNYFATIWAKTDAEAIAAFNAGNYVGGVA